MPTTNYPDGVTNAVIGSAMQTFMAPDPSRTSFLADDFYRLNAAATGSPDWFVTGVNPVVPTVTAAKQYGQITFAPVGATDSTYIQYSGAQAAVVTPFLFTAGKDVWFKTKFQVSNALQPNVIAGLTLASSTPIAAADGVFFIKPAGSTTVSLKAIKTGAGTNSLAVGTVADATDITLGFHYSPLANAGAGAIFAYLNDVLMGSMPITNMPTVGLSPVIGILNATAARTLQVDYIQAAQAR